MSLRKPFSGRVCVEKSEIFWKIVFAFLCCHLGHTVSLWLSSWSIPACHLSTVVSLETGRLQVFHGAKVSAQAGRGLNQRCARRSLFQRQGLDVFQSIWEPCECQTTPNGLNFGLSVTWSNLGLNSATCLMYFWIGMVDCRHLPATRPRRNSSTSIRLVRHQCQSLPRSMA